MNLLEFLILSLATWRFSSMFVNEVGPGRIFQKFRERIAGIQHDPDGEAFMIPETFIAGLFSCVWCLSVWVGLGVGILWLISPVWAFRVSLPFALSAGAILIERIAQSKSQ